MWRRLLPRSAGESVPAEAPAPAQRIVVLEQGRTPSGDYLLRPWLHGEGGLPGLPLVVHDTRETPKAGQIMPGDRVVIARYLPPLWFKALDAKRAQVAGLVYFMDDDLLDPAVLAELPRAYAQKIERMALAHRSWLKKNGAALWVSTPALAEKYAGWSPRVLPMAPPPPLMARRRSVRIAYHGTASHVHEIEWLHGVLARVQESRTNTHVELFGDLTVHRWYRDLPRVSVLHPMSWENYLAYSASHHCDIGLAPLRPGRFNAARGPTKFWDYARLGAAGLYADVPPYAGFVNDGVDGLLLPDDRDAWVAAILGLADDAERRGEMAAAARRRASPARPQNDSLK